MELLDKGKHCSDEYCHQFDFLPSKCKACSKIFCNEHIKYDNHKCKEAYKFNFQIPACPLCNKTIEFQRGRDLDICLAEHMQSCENQENTNKKIVNKNQCSVIRCKNKKSIIPFECNNCSKKYCLQHRIPEDHDCQGKNNGQYTDNTNIFKSCSQQHNAVNNSKANNNFFTAKNF